MMRKLAAITVVGVAVSLGFSQSSPSAEFEVASVRSAPVPSGTNSNDWANQVRMRIDPGRLMFVHPTLEMVIASAYGLRGYQVSGPEWIKTERYDISATLPTGTERPKALLMLRKLLELRFGLRCHNESRELPVYALVDHKSSGKLHATDQGGTFPLSNGPRGLRLSGNASMTQLAASLSRQVDRPVIDMTSLKGNFEITLDWAQSRRQSITNEPSEGAAGPTVFEALEEQLGLRLKPQKGMIETLVIDRVEKVPTPN